MLQGVDTKKVFGFCCGFEKKDLVGGLRMLLFEIVGRRTSETRSYVAMFGISGAQAPSDDSQTGTIIVTRCFDD